MIFAGAIPIERHRFFRDLAASLSAVAWAHITRLSHRISRSSRDARLSVHHTSSAVNLHNDQGMVAFDIESVLLGHQKRNLEDIGYPFVTDRTGRIWEGRVSDFTGAHLSSKNDENIGVMILGDFKDQQPSDHQVPALPASAITLQDHHSISRERSHRHCDLGNTLYPGRHMYPNVKILQ